MSRARSPYSLAERAEALALAEEVGAAEAARRLDLSPDLIRQWRRRVLVAAEAAAELVERHTTPDPEPEPAASEPAVEPEPAPPPAKVAPSTALARLADTRGPWSVRAPAIVEALAEVSANAVVALDEAVREGRGRDAKDLAIACGIVLDKSLLLGGHPTSRSVRHDVKHVVDDGRGERVAEQIEALRAELGMPSASSEIVDAEVVEDE